MKKKTDRVFEDYFDLRSSLDFGSVPTDAHGPCASRKSDLNQNEPFVTKLEAKNCKIELPKIAQISLLNV